MNSMIISTAKGYTEQFCVTCADTDSDLRAQLEKNLGHIEVTDQVFGERCDACGRPIQEIPAYKRLYLLKPELRIVLTAEIPASSALEARLRLHEALDPKEVLEKVRGTIGYDLEGDLLAGQETLTTHVAEPQVLPPPREEWVADLPATRVPVASPPATFSDFLDLALVQKLLDRYLQSGLDGRYTGSFECCLLLHQLFAQAEVNHCLMQGYLSHEPGTAHPHVWIDLSSSLGPGWLVDYRARNRFGHEAPLGLFPSKEYPHFSYYGVQSPLPLFPPKGLLQDLEEALRELTLS